MEAARTLLGDIAQYFVGPADPRDQLDTLDRDRRDTEAEIRAVLDRLASKYDVPSDDVDETMESIGLVIGDMTCEPETEYLESMDIKNKV